MKIHEQIKDVDAKLAKIRSLWVDFPDHYSLLGVQERIAMQARAMQESKNSQFTKAYVGSQNHPNPFSEYNPCSKFGLPSC